MEGIKHNTGSQVADISQGLARVSLESQTAKDRSQLQVWMGKVEEMGQPISRSKHTSSRL